VNQGFNLSISGGNATGVTFARDNDVTAANNTTWGQLAVKGNINEGGNAIFVSSTEWGFNVTQSALIDALGYNSTILEGLKVNISSSATEGYFNLTVTTRANGNCSATVTNNTNLLVNIRKAKVSTIANSTWFDDGGASGGTNEVGKTVTITFLISNGTIGAMGAEPISFNITNISSTNKTEITQTGSNTWTGTVNTRDDGKIVLNVTLNGTVGVTIRVNASVARADCGAATQTDGTCFKEVTILTATGSAAKLGVFSDPSVTKGSTAFSWIRLQDQFGNNLTT
jgi:hypothetical protein